MTGKSEKEVWMEKDYLVADGCRQGDGFRSGSVEA